MHLMDLIGCIDQREQSNDAMIRRLQGDGTLSKPAIADALRAVDRGVYVGTERPDLNYADMPIKLGVVHLSAPSIYASALEALDVREGHSFLHIGSGTGYLSTVVSLLAGPHTVNHGVEVEEELVRLARTLTSRRALHHIEFFCANAHQLCVEKSMQYDRVYISAAAPPGAHTLFRLLRVGGVLVGPFDADDDDPYGGGHQYLVKVVRTSATEFSRQLLQPVQFAPLRQPSPASLKELPELALQPLVWSCETHPRFPPRFRAAVRAVLWACKQPECALAVLPAELVLRLISALPFFCFEPHLPPLPSRATTDAVGEATGRVFGTRGASRHRPTQTIVMGTSVGATETDGSEGVGPTTPAADETPAASAPLDVPSSVEQTGSPHRAALLFEEDAIFGEEGDGEDDEDEGAGPGGVNDNTPPHAPSPVLASIRWFARQRVRRRLLHAALTDG